MPDAGHLWHGQRGLKKLRLALYEHLWLGSRAAPDEYIDLLLCRDVYHCTPVALDGVPAEVVQTHLALLEAEAGARKANQRAAAQRKPDGGAGA